MTRPRAGRPSKDASSSPTGSYRARLKAPRCRPGRSPRRFGGYLRGLQPNEARSPFRVLIDAQADGEDLEALAAELTDHPLTRADGATMSRLLAQVGTAAVLRTPDEAGRGNSARMARFGQAVQRLWQAHETMTGGVRSLPPRIRVVFELQVRSPAIGAGLAIMCSVGPYRSGKCDNVGEAPERNARCGSKTLVSFDL